MFPRLSYLEWMGARADRAPFDLATTDLGGGAADGVVPDVLADLEPAPAGASLETLLATEYGVDPEQVLVTAGASHANVIATATALERHEGTGVVVERPGYQPLVETPRGLGAEVTRFDRPDGGLDRDAVAEEVNGDTVQVTVSNRHNPTGVLADRETIDSVAAVTRANDATLLVDEVYAPYGPEEREGAFGGPTGADLEGVVVTGSLTKFFGLGDLRIGWLIGDAAFVSRARSIAMHVPDVAGPSRTLAERALYAGADLADAKRSRIATNADLLADFVEERADLAGSIPAGATFGTVEPTEISVEDLIPAAWDDGVLVVPGHFFDAPGTIRVGAGGSPSDVEVALRRFGAVLANA